MDKEERKLLKEIKLNISKASLSGGGGGGGAGTSMRGPSPFGGGTTNKSISEMQIEVSEIKEDVKILKKLQEETEKVLINAHDVVSQAKDINNFTTYFLFVLVVAFFIAYFQMVSDYNYHLDEQRRYFSEILKNYQTKENSQEDINNFKSCLRTYNLNVCTKSIK